MYFALEKKCILPKALLTGDYNVLFLENSCLSLHSAFSSLSHWSSVTSSSQTKFHVRRIFLVSLAWSWHGWKYRIFHRDDTEIRARGYVSEKSSGIFIIPLGPFARSAFSWQFVGGCVLDLILRKHWSSLIILTTYQSSGKQVQDTTRDTLLETEYSIPFSAEQ